MGDPRQALAEAIRDSGLVPAGSRGVALLSGGPDSAALACGLATHLGAGAVTGLHVNYGLRPDSDADEQVAAELCAGLGIELVVDRAALPPGTGNLQGAAREARYEAAEALARARGCAWIASGHTRTDLAETVLYRLASSPGRRALLGMPDRRGLIVRPLLGLGRDQTRMLAERAGLPFRDDPSNLDPRYARNRIRSEVLPVLREIAPAVEATIAQTRAELEDESRLVAELVAEALSRADTGAGLAASVLAGMRPALRRLVLRGAAERASGSDLALGPERGEQILRLAGSPEGGEIELGGGWRAVCEYGLIRFEGEARPAPGPVGLGVPGSASFGEWELEAELLPAPVEPLGPDVATLDAGVLGGELTVRAWREGDRMRPLGLGGTKSLQDLFSDARVPRGLRRRLPLVESEGKIAWIAGIATGEEFRIGPQTREVAVLTARRKR